MPLPWLNAKPANFNSLSTLGMAWWFLASGIFSPQVGSYSGSDKFICCCDPRFRICTALMSSQMPKRYCLQFDIAPQPWLG